LEKLNRASALRLKQVRLVGRGINEILPGIEAFEQSDSQGLDLILVSNDVTPPVVRIQDQKKIEYEKKKARKAQKPSSMLKEIRLQINISEHDLSTKINKIEEFLKRGDKVKITVKLKGRERENPQRAHDIIDKVVARVPAKANKIFGPNIMALLEPLKSIK
jgi:translation initiation factor IF-3